VYLQTDVSLNTYIFGRVIWLEQDITKQISEQQKAMLVAGVMVILMMIIPGFPKIPFVILSVALFFGGRRLAKPTRVILLMVLQKGVGLPFEALRPSLNNPLIE
jgi:hypothetical protein